MKLVIVESPTKSKTIGKYLGEGYDVEASVGHIRDLAISGKGGLGVDIEHDFKPTYVVNKDKKKVVDTLKKLSKKAEEVILATDPDREGEAIARHLSDVLGLPIDSTKRLEFHEITKESIAKAMEDPRTIDMNLVHAQEARRIIDRILGFKLSTLLQAKIRSKSAGRVQSVTLKIICDHEEEIQAFVPEEYWTIDANILKDGKEFSPELSYIGNEKVKISNEKEAQEIASKIGDKLKVSSIDVVRKATPSKEAFRTSTMQQEAFTRYGMKTKETTFLAQQLYEGVDTDQGPVGLITYIRTDSTRISPEFVSVAKTYIISNFGEIYYRGAKVSKDVKNAQDAHECIRPTSLERTPEKMKAYLSERAYKLYKLIYERALASLMSDKVVESTTVKFESDDLIFDLKGSKQIFDGYSKVYSESKDDDTLPQFNQGEEIAIDKVESKQHFTKAPNRYSEAAIVKIMEDKGIGRPSTYASTIQTLIERKYITNTKGILAPTEQGVLTSNVLTKYFPDLMNETYTANMETSLDKIEGGEDKELEVIREFYDSFEPHFEQVRGEMYKEPLKKTGEKCPLCGGDLVVRNGRYGEFVACENYPTCKYVKKEEKEEPKEVGRQCPVCGSPLVYRKNRKGQTFIGCSAFPKCHYIENVDGEKSEKPIEEKKICPECGGIMVLRRSKRGYFYGCSNFPKCHHIEPYDNGDKKEKN
jgi:DNA topoisomerase-1